MRVQQAFLNSTPKKVYQKQSIAFSLAPSPSPSLLFSSQKKKALIPLLFTAFLGLFGENASLHAEKPDNKILISQQTKRIEPEKPEAFMQRVSDDVFSQIKELFDQPIYSREEAERVIHLMDRYHLHLITHPDVSVAELSEAHKKLYLNSRSVWYRNDFTDEEQAFGLITLKMYNTIIEKLHQHLKKNPSEQNEIESILNEMQYSVLWTESFESEPINDSAAEIYTKWFLKDSVVTQLAEAYREHGNPLSKKILQHVISSPLQDQINLNLKSKFDVIQTKREGEAYQSRITELLNIHHHIIHSFPEWLNKPDKKATDAETAVKQWFQKSLHMPLFQQYLSDSLYLHDYAKPTESEDMRDTIFSNHLETFLFDALAHQPELAEIYLKGIQTQMLAHEQDDKFKIYLYHQLANIPVSPKLMPMVQDFFLERLVTETSDSAVKQGLAPIFSMLFLKELIPQKHQTQTYQAVDQHYAEKIQHLDTLYQALLKPDFKEDKTAFSPLQSLFIEMANHAASGDANQLLERVKTNYLNLNPNTRSFYDEMERSRKNSIMTVGTMAQKLFQLDTAAYQKWILPDIFKDISRQCTFPNHWRDKEIDTIYVQRHHVIGLIDKVQLIEDCLVNRLSELKGYFRSDELLSEMVVQCLKAEDAKSHTLQQSQNSRNQRLALLAKNFPGIGFRDAKGPYIDVYENAKDALYSAVHHNIPRYYKKKDEKLDQLARRFAESCQKVFTFDLLLKLWQVELENNVVEGVRMRSEHQFKKELYEVLKGLHLDDAEIRYQYNKKLQDDEEPFQQTLQTWKTQAVQERQTLLNEVNNILRTRNQ